METTILAAALAAIIATASAGNHQQNGYRDTGCDPAAQIAITNDKGDVLYYNNATCPAGSGSGGASGAASGDPVDPDQRAVN